MSIVERRGKYQVFSCIYGITTWVRAFDNKEDAERFNDRIIKWRDKIYNHNDKKIEKKINTGIKQGIYTLDKGEDKTLTDFEVEEILTKLASWKKKLNWQEENKGFKEHIKYR